MKTNAFIAVLSEDAPVRWTFGRALAVATPAGALIAGAVFFLGIHVRPDLAHAAETVRFLFKFVVTLTLALAAIAMVLRIARPGVPLGRSALTLAIAPLLLCLAVAAELLVMPESTWGTRLIGTNARFCVTLIPLMALGPLACLLLALRQGAPTRPGLAGALAGLAASGIAATFYAAHCPDDSPLFVATWYPLATAIMVLIGSLAGSRFLRW